MQAKQVGFILLLALGGFLIVLWIFNTFFFNPDLWFFNIWFLNPERIGIDSSGMLTLLYFLVLGFGLFLIIFSSIMLSINKTKQEKLDSMSEKDLADMFACQTDNGNVGAVYLIRLTTKLVIVSYRCPLSGKKSFRIPIRLFDACLPYFKDTIFRCFKCGKESTIDHTKFSGPWILIKLTCPTHGNSLPYHKIWKTVYNQITSEVNK